MFGKALETPLPGEERKDNTCITTIYRSVLPKAIHACPDHFTHHYFQMEKPVMNQCHQI